MKADRSKTNGEPLTARQFLLSTRGYSGRYTVLTNLKKLCVDFEAYAAEWKTRAEKAEGDTRELKAALRLAKTRLQICLGRFAGCEDGAYSKTTVTYGDKVEKRHEVSLAEIPAWIEDMERLLGEPTNTVK